MTDYIPGASDIGMEAGSDSRAHRAVSAMFDTHADAEKAVNMLRQAGIPDATIRITHGNERQGARTGSTTEGDNMSTSKGFFESLGDLFFPEDDRATYAEGLHRGGHLVTVTHLTETAWQQAVDVLEDAGAVDIDERSETWRSEGWSAASGMAGAGMAGSASAGTGFAEAQGSYASGSAMQDSDLTGQDFTPGAARLGQPATMTDADRVAAAGGASVGIVGDAGNGGGMSGLAAERAQYADAIGRGDDTIEVMEERLRIGKREELAGRVRVRAYVVEEPVNETVSLRDERVEIERRPVDRAFSGSADAFADRTIEAEAYREEAVVSKEARIVEEIGVRKTATERQETVRDTIRHTEVEIEDDRDDSLTGRR